MFDDIIKSNIKQILNCDNDDELMSCKIELNDISSMHCVATINFKNDIEAKLLIDNKKNKMVYMKNVNVLFYKRNN